MYFLVEFLSEWLWLVVLLCFLGDFFVRLVFPRASSRTRCVLHTRRVANGSLDKQYVR